MAKLKFTLIFIYQLERTKDKNNYKMKKITLETLKKNITEGKVELFRDHDLADTRFFHVTVKNVNTKKYSAYELVRKKLSESTKAFFNL